jgi:hypothetical protein
MVVQAEKDHPRHHCCHCHPQPDVFIFEVAAKQPEERKAAAAAAVDEQSFHCCSLLLAEGRPTRGRIGESSPTPLDIAG